MATRSSEREDPTHPSEIPTAVIDQDPFAEDEGTVADATTSEDRSSASAEADDTPTVRKFRRPSPSEIASAVDQVNTEAVDAEELRRAHAARLEEDEEDE